MQPLEKQSALNLPLLLLGFMASHHPHPSIRVRQSKLSLLLSTTASQS